LTSFSLNNQKHIFIFLVNIDSKLILENIRHKALKY